MKTKKLSLVVAICALVFNSAFSQGENCTVTLTTTIQDMEFSDSVIADTDQNGIDDYNIILGKTDEDGNAAIQYVPLVTGNVDFTSNIPNNGGLNDFTKPLRIEADTQGIFISAETGLIGDSAFVELKYLPFFSQEFDNSKNKKIIGGGIKNISYINGYIYIYLTVDKNNYDPLSSGWILPVDENGPNVQQFLIQIDAVNSNMNWVVSLESASINSRSKYILLPNNNIGVSVDLSNGGSALREYNSTTGAFVQTLLSGSDWYDDRYRFSQNKFIKYDELENKTTIYDQNLVEQNSTIWDFAHWNRRLRDMRLFDDGTMIGVDFDDIMFFEPNLIHKFAERVLGMDGDNVDIRINDDKSVTFINSMFNGNTTGTDRDVKIYKVTVTEDTGNIPSINEAVVQNLLNVYTAKKPISSSLTDVGNYESTMTFSDGNVPEVGFTPPSSWISTSEGYEFWIAFPVEEVNGIRQFRALARNVNDGLDVYNILVYMVEQSTLGIEDISFTDFTIYPNPVHDVLHISSQELVKKIQFFDLGGREIYTQSDAFGIENMNISSFSHGMYLMKVYTNRGVGIKKIIKN